MDARSLPFSGRAPGRDGALAPSTERALEDLPDEALAVRAKDGGPAFALIYDRYVDRVYRYLRYRTSDPRDAEDLTSDVGSWRRSMTWPIVPMVIRPATRKVT